MSGNGHELTPLRGLLDNVLGRLEALESKVGITPASVAAVPKGGIEPSGESPAVTAYKTHVEKSVRPFQQACDELGGLKDIGTQIRTAWEGIGHVIKIASNCKKPAKLEELNPHLKITQDALAKIRQCKVSREFDHHYKAIMEMVVCCSWVMVTPPPSPSNFVKETIGSSEYWSNKIRKEHKGKNNAKQIAFCDTLKALILDLSEYCKEYHLSGLRFNPKGIPLSEVKVADKLEDKHEVVSKEGAGAAAGGMQGIMSELAKKTHGDSAATGLKHVTKKQQTWRKEFEGTSKKPTTTTSSKTTTTKALGPPKCEYQQIGHKWIVENQTKESNPDGKLDIQIKDSKEQIYIYNCENATFQITGKFKTVIVDNCTKCNVIFDTVISSCEVVNSTKIQIQTNGVCPTFSIDETDGCLIYLSKETMNATSIMTCKSTEMNVNWTDDDGEVKEAPIPEQYQHKMVNGVIETSVSDLYH